jgi:quinolinate synthase
VLFFPDQHLGRWTGYKKGIPLDQMVVWDPDLEYGGLTREQIHNAKILLWKGHCSVHQMFQPGHIERWRKQHPEGLVISHPESSLDVCIQSDYVGSTEYIIKTIEAGAPGTRWLVGTELNLVNRLAEEMKPQGKIVQFMAPTVCMCSTMQRIDPQHLAWTLENLAEGNIVNQIRVPAHEAELARVALDRMLAVS